MNQLRQPRPGLASSSAVLVAGYILVCIIWGTNWVAIKVAVTDMPPLLAGGLRFVMAAPLLALLCRRYRQPIIFPRDQALFAVAITLAYFTVPYVILNIAGQYISSGLTAICFAMVAVLIVVLSVPVLGATVGWIEISGVLIAFCALVTLISSWGEIGSASAWAAGGTLLAAALHAVCYVGIKRQGAAVHPLTLNTVPALAAGLMMIGASLIWEQPTWASFTVTGMIATTHLAVVASVIGLLIYFSLLQRLSALTMSFVFVLFPLVAQVFSHQIEDEELRFLDIALILLILAAMAATLAAPSLRTKVAALRTSETWRPTQDQLTLIYQEAILRYPEEACGYVRRHQVVPCSNAVSQVSGVRRATDRNARTGFAFSSADLLALHQSLDGDDPARMIFHSHPDVGAYFSEEDQAFAVQGKEATYPALHLVVDVSASEVRGSRLFAFDPSTCRYRDVAEYGVPRPDQGNHRSAVDG